MLLFLGSTIIIYFLLWFFFFFKQKTAYEMRISDWSSDVCSSDLPYFRLLSRASAKRGHIYNVFDSGRDRCVDGSQVLRRTGTGTKVHGRNNQEAIKTSISGSQDRKSTRLNSSH